MNVLITGATGFVGTALVKRFSASACALSAAVLEGEDVSHLPAAVDRRVIVPLSADGDYRGALQGIDVVVHLAARVHVMHDSAENPLEEFRKVNLHGTRRLAEQAAQAGVKRFVFVSTVKVLGEESPVPYTEESPLRPQDAYSVSKAEAEAALRLVEVETGLEVVVIRPPLVYGAGVRANFQQLLQLANRGVPLPLASIRNQRSFVYVENLADALLACAAHQAAAGRTYLVSDGEDVSTPDLFRRVAVALGRPARLMPFPIGLIRAGGALLRRSPAVGRLVGSLQVDCSRVTAELGWTAPHTLDEGLRATAEWFAAVHP